MFKASKASRIPHLLLATSLTFGLSGCLTKPQPQLTAEEQRQAAEMRELLIARMKQQLQQPTVQAPSQSSSAAFAAGSAAAVPAEVLTETQLTERVRLLPISSELVDVEQRKDGFVVNGRAVIDMEGRIVDAGYNELTGQFTYLVETSETGFALRYGTSQSQERVTIATGFIEGDSYRVRTVTGNNLAGQRLIPIADGFIVARDQAAFKYRIGSGATSLATPSSYHVAGLQQGDVASTGYLLLEKEAETSKRQENLFSAVMDLADTVTDIVDRQARDHYQLINLETGEAVVVDVDRDAKTTAFMSGCRRKNDLVNVCSQSQLRESLYRQNGLPNHGHYYWNIRWYNTASGPFLVAREKGTAQITVTHLPTREKRVAFERTLGISSFDVLRKGDGKLALEASLGFNKERIDDLEAWFNQPQSGSKQS